MIHRIRELVHILNEAAKAYYQENQEIMSNQRYDQLYDELEALEQKSGIILSNSPTQKVGYEILSNLKKIRHESKMLSLDKTKEIQKLKSWLGTQEGVLSWKLDGLTIVLTYRAGKLVQAVTRGSGEVGEDVTHNARVFKNIPLTISFQEEVILRGEAVISYPDFAKINELLPVEQQYKNPRNLCSGTVRQLNSEIAAKRHVQFFAFSVVKAEGQDFEDQKLNQIKWLKEQGFGTIEYMKVKADTIEEAVVDFEKRIASNDFASDGLVLTYNYISYGESLGATSKFPRDSIAFKWADEMQETQLLQVQWNTSRTGLINPVAVFEPVELEGTTVNRASVHNLSIIEDLQLGIGDTVKVYKANMIIPQIAENVTRSGTLYIPKQCPVCEGETEIKQAREGKALYCMNPNCRAQRVQALAHYCSRDAMNIEGLSEATIEKFIKHKYLLHFPDLYTLQDYEQEIKSMEGFGEKSYQNLIQAIEKSKQVALPNFIYALGIHHVGLSNAKLLCSYYKYDLSAIMDAGEEELVQIEGFGSIIAHSIHQYFHHPDNQKLIKTMIQYLNIEKPDIKKDIQIFQGKTFVITGDVQHFKNRKEMQEKIESLGGKVTGSVTNKTNFLINNDFASSSSKNKKARDLEIPIITEEQFLQMMD